ncbi:hypothetical protein PPERSA_12401 [Pseudocohnilembus persalinus]|uniref:Uncharacterized protein n=1 Tax=Pseudocohnilembus persalinus TaxID=266149 RepID=A0A0V0QNV7_PSEPJ|nr:hypothetical protein PPERSA_12401 [Pseudocohnilembus persalinus]|eukprot:KRX03954.1 hypothetical protein PPERSA_12401 [Pseudocohnilembus persalinus]
MDNESNLLKQLKDKIPQVDIEIGTFKYVLLKAEFNEETYYFVRGFKRCPFHANNFQVFIEELEKSQLFDSIGDLDDVQLCKKGDQKIKITCTGGGRIQHDDKDQKIFVYGYSQGYGLAKHEISVEILKKQYQQYPSDNITWSNEGY